MDTTNFRWYRSYRCRLCLTVFRLEANESQPTFIIASTSLSEQLDKKIGLEKEQHLCPNGGLGVADFAGYIRGVS